MKLHQLRDFVAVATTGSLRAGARKLGLTQPALTKSIQSLEKELGYALFDRHARGATLSVAGRTFLPRAEAAMNELSRGVSELQQLGGAEGQVNMALSAAVSLTCLPDAMAAFRRRHPTCQVRVVSSSFTVMSAELRAGALDFCIGLRPNGALSEEFSVARLFTNTLAVICRKENPLRHAKSLAELTEAQWIVSAATGVPTAEHDQIFNRLGLPVPRSVVQCEYPTAIFGLLAGTDMFAIMPRQWAEAAGMRGLFAVVPVREELPGTDIVLIQKAGFPLTPAATGMLDLLLREIQRYAKDLGLLTDLA